MVWLKRILIIFTIVAVIAGAAGWYIAKKYDTIVQQIIISNLNKQLSVPVNVNSINLSLFSSFPYASLDFNDVFIPESYLAIGQPDTLLFAKKLKLNFNIIDIYKGNYTIKRIEVIDAQTKIKYNQKGQPNFDIFKPTADTAQTNFNIQLTEVQLKKITFNYSDKKNEQSINGFAENLVAEGNFSETEFTLQLDGSFNNFYYVQPDIHPLFFKSVKTYFQLDVNTKNQSVSITKNELVINQIHSFNVAGSITPKQYNITVVGNKIRLPQAIELYTTTWNETLNKYGFEALADVKLVTQKNNDKQAGNTAISLTLQNITLKTDSQSQPLKNGYFSGKLLAQGNNFGKANIAIDSLYFPIQQGEIMAKGLVENIQSPKFTVTMNGKTNYNAEWNHLNTQKWPKMSGLFSWSGEIIWPAWTWNFGEENLQRLQFNNFKVIAENVEIPLDNEEKMTINFALAIFQPNTLQIDSLTAQRRGSDIQFTGSIANYWKYLMLPQQKLLIKGWLSSKNLNFDDLIIPSSNQPTESQSFVPSFLALNIFTNIQTFKYGSFTANQTSAELLVSSKTIKAKNLSLHTMDGELKTQLKLTPISETKLQFNATGNTKNIAVNQLFESFKNFNQSYIRSNHLEGKATSEFSASGIINHQFEPDYKSLNALVDLNIDEGRLIGFEPLKEIAQYFKTHPVLKRLINTSEFEKRVSDIKFSQLNNTLNLSNEVVTLPNINIVSSALNMQVEGTHTFTNDINYSISFNLKDLMMKEAQNSTEFGEIEDDGLGGKIIYLKITGNVDDFTIAWDKSRKKQAQKQNIEKEKEELKRILKEEFKQQQSQPAEEKEFEIIWEEFETQQEDSTSLNKMPLDTVTKEDGKLKKLLKKAIENPENKEKQPQIVLPDDF